MVYFFCTINLARAIFRLLAPCWVAEIEHTMAAINSIHICPKIAANGQFQKYPPACMSQGSYFENIEAHNNIFSFSTPTWRQQPVSKPGQTNGGKKYIINCQKYFHNQQQLFQNQKVWPGPYSTRLRRAKWLKLKI